MLCLRGIESAPTVDVQEPGTRTKGAQSIEALKVIGGSVVVLGWMCIHWFSIGQFRDARVIAARRGLSTFRIAPPYNRWGVDARCDMWTLCGSFVGVLLGLSIGWAILDSLPLGVFLAGAGALIAGWHYRVVASLFAVDRHAHDAVEQPHAAEGRESSHNPAKTRRGLRDGRLELALAAIACGVAVAVVGLSRSDAHSPIAVVGFATVLFVAWRVMRIAAGQRAS